jgi:hypothetical protein
MIDEVPWRIRCFRAGQAQRGGRPHDQGAAALLTPGPRKVVLPREVPATVKLAMPARSIRDGRAKMAKAGFIMNGSARYVQSFL